MSCFAMHACSALAALLLFFETSLRAQTVVAEKTTMYSGTVAEYEPVRQTLILRGDASAPITHHVTQATRIVDESGAAVRSETIVNGVPVVVHSIREGDRRIASRIVVKKAVEAPAPVVERVTAVPESLERTRTVTTTTSAAGAGTITAYTPGMPTLVLRNDTTPQPVTYSVTKTTSFVDESGAPIQVERIGPGVPVTVHYVREGDHMLAERVVVTRDREEIRRVRNDRREGNRDRDDDDRRRRR